MRRIPPKLLINPLKRMTKKEANVFRTTYRPGINCLTITVSSENEDVSKAGLNIEIIKLKDKWMEQPTKEYLTEIVDGKFEVSTVLVPTL